MLNLPREILEIIGSHLSISDYHHLRLASKSMVLPTLPCLTWQAYTDSISPSLVQNMSNVCTLKLQSVKEDYLTILYNHEQFLLIEKFLQKYSIRDVHIANDLFLKFCFFGNSSLAHLLIQSATNLQVSEPDTSRLYSRLLFYNHIRVLHSKNDAICYAASYGYTDIIQLILEHPSLDTDMLSNSLICAAHAGHLACVRLLIQDARIDPAYDNHLALKIAIENNYEEIALTLLADERTDPSCQDNICIRKSCENGNLNVLRHLLQDTRVDPRSGNNYCLCITANLGLDQCLKLLLEDPRVDPTVHDYYIVRIALSKGHEKVINLLTSDPRVCDYANQVINATSSKSTD